MKNKRRIAGIIFLILAISFGGLSFKISKDTQKTTEIIVLKKNIEKGTLIKEEDIGVSKRGSYNLSNEVIKEKKTIVGKIALKDMKKEREIYIEDITSDSNKGAFSSKIVGKAIAIKTDLASSVGGEILPDSFVQIVTIAKGGNGEVIANYPENVKAVRVLEVKQDSGLSTTKENSNNNTNVQEQKKPAIIVLDMNEEQIKQILPYNYNGAIHLILLNEELSKVERKKIGL